MCDKGLFAKDEMHVWAHLNFVVLFTMLILLLLLSSFCFYILYPSVVLVSHRGLVALAVETCKLISFKRRVAFNVVDVEAVS